MRNAAILRLPVLILASALLFGAAPARAQQQTPPPQQQWTDANGKVYPMDQANGAPMAAPAGAPVMAQNPATYQGPDYGYVLGSGDKIHVTVFGEENLSGDFDVDGSGLVRLPLVGTMQAGGLTAHALEATITQALANGYLNNPRVTVSVATYRPFFIIGEVSKPGQYSYMNNMNALNAVAMAGGYTPHAVESTLYIRHQGETTEHEYPANQTTRIYPGDVVRVPDTVFWRIMSYALPITTFGRPY